MQFIADIMKSMHKKGYITIDDLYTLSEAEVLQLIKTCDDSYIRNSFNLFENATRDSIYKSNFPNNMKLHTYIGFDFDFKPYN